MLRIQDVMTRKVITVSPEHTLREAMELLATNHLSGAPVVSNQKVVGVVSATDLLEFAAALPPVSSDRDEEDNDAADPGESPEDMDAYGDEDEEAGAGVGARWFNQRWHGHDIDETERFSEGSRATWTALDEHVVSEVMTRKVVKLRPTVSLTAAADLLRRKRLHRVLVMEGNALLGIPSTSDIVRVVADGKLVRTRWVFKNPGEV